MGRIAYVSLVVLAILCVICIGAGVPIASMYYSVNYGLNVILTGVISFISLVCAGGLGFFILTFVFEEHGLDLLREEMSSKDREKLSALRAHLRATLEELDEVNVLLKDIRDILKEAGG